MRNPSGLVVVALLNLTVLLGSGGQAAADCPLGCPAGQVFPTGGNMPANMVSFDWDPPFHDGVYDPDARAKLYALRDGARVELPHEMVGLDGTHVETLAPVDPVAAGTTLLLAYEHRCGGQSTTSVTEVQVTAAAVPPRALGTLAATLARGSVSAPGAEVCTVAYDAAYADLTVTLDPAAEPFRDVVSYLLEVDGQVRKHYLASGPVDDRIAEPLGGSALGRGRDRIFTVCGASAQSEPRALREGTHRVRVVGLLPDRSRITSNEITVELRCDDDAPAGAVVDAGLVTRADASTQPDATTFPDSDAQSNADAGDAGCALSAAGRAPRAAAPWLGLSLLCLARLSRLRRGWLRRGPHRA